MSNYYPNRMKTYYPEGNNLPYRGPMPNEPIFRLKTRDITVEVVPRGTYWGHKREPRIEIINSHDYYGPTLESWDQVDELVAALNVAAAAAFGNR